MPSSIYYNGKQTFTPGVYSTLDASALSATSTQASGILALIGSAVGGKPYTAIASRRDFPVFTSMAALKNAYPAGDILEAANIAFAPSNDPGILGGAQQVVVLKVDPATPATLTLKATDNTASLILTSQQYGPAANGVNVSIATGSQSGKLLTISNGLVTETKDNLGGGSFGSITYNGGLSNVTGGFDANGNFSATAATNYNGLASESSGNTAFSNQTLTITATAADANKSMTILGFDSLLNTAVSETVSLGATTTTTTKQFGVVTGAYLNTAAAGPISISSSQGTSFQFAAGQTTRGINVLSGVSGGGKQLSFSNVQAGRSIIIEGYNTANQLVVERIQGSGTTTTAFASITRLGLGNVSNAFTLGGQVAQFVAAPTSTVADLQAYLIGQNAGQPGLTLTLTDSSQATTKLVNLDKGTQGSLAGAGLTLSAAANAFASWINANSQLVTAAISPTASGGPANTAASYLTGGTQSLPTYTDWQNCLNLLQQIRVNTVVPLTCDPSVAHAADAHCDYMCGPGRSERDCVVGLQNTALTDVPSLAQIQTQVQALNSRHTRAAVQAITVYGTSGSLVEMQPQFTAALLAGMQAGAGVGNSLTHKSAKVIGVRQHVGWNPVVNSDALIQAGAVILESVDNIGTRVVRNITTWLRDTNPAYCEASVNQATDFSVYNFRLALEAYVGQPNFSGTLNAVSAAATSILQRLLSLNIITAFQPPTVVAAGDTILVSISIAPIQPTNFIQTTVHLVANAAA